MKNFPTAKVKSAGQEDQPTNSLSTQHPAPLTLIAIIIIIEKVEHFFPAI